MMRANFGANLKRIRKEQGLTQAEFGEELGIGRNAIARYEKGETFPPTAKIEHIVETLGCTVGELFDEPNRGVLIPRMQKPICCRACPFMRAEYNIAANKYIFYCPLLEDEIDSIESGCEISCPLEEV